MSSGDIFENIVFPKGGPNKTPLAKMGNYNVARISLGEGARIAPHMANHSAVFVVLQGRAIITDGDGEVELGKDQFIAMEANRMRGIQALEDLVILGIHD